MIEKSLNHVSIHCTNPSAICSICMWRESTWEKIAFWTTTVMGSWYRATAWFLVWMSDFQLSFCVTLHRSFFFSFYSFLLSFPPVSAISTCDQYPNTNPHEHWPKSTTTTFYKRVPTKYQFMFCISMFSDTYRSQFFSC